MPLTDCDASENPGVYLAGSPTCIGNHVLDTTCSSSVDQGELIQIPPTGGITMKRISLVAVAAMLFAGAQLHAQAMKQDSSKKMKMAKPAASATSAAKSAEKAADKATAAAKTADKAGNAAKMEAKDAKKAATKAEGAADNATASAKPRHHHKRGKRKAGMKKGMMMKNDSTAKKP